MVCSKFAKFCLIFSLSFLFGLFAGGSHRSIIFFVKMCFYIRLSLTYVFSNLVFIGILNCLSFFKFRLKFTNFLVSFFYRQSFIPFDTFNQALKRNNLICSISPQCIDFFLNLTHIIIYGLTQLILFFHC